jgi:hypothetical protein
MLGVFLLDISSSHPTNKDIQGLGHRAHERNVESKAEVHLKVLVALPFADVDHVQSRPSEALKTSINISA